MESGLNLVWDAQTLLEDHLDNLNLQLVVDLERDRAHVSSARRHEAILLGLALDARVTRLHHEPVAALHAVPKGRGRERIRWKIAVSKGARARKHPL